MYKKRMAVLFALLAAALYAFHIPFAKLLMGEVPPTMLAGFLYLGAGVGVGLIFSGKILCKGSREIAWLDRQDLRYTVAMVVLDIAAPIFLMLGIAGTTSANVSLLNNLEIVATSVIALLLFGERISRKLWCAVFFCGGGKRNSRL